jgi:hypothetical protein
MERPHKRTAAAGRILRSEWPTQPPLGRPQERRMPTASVAVMFAQLSEMITLNFNVFTDAELAAMPEALKPVREMADAQTLQSRRPRGVHGQTETDPRYQEGFRKQGAEIVRAIDAFLAQC